MANATEVAIWGTGISRREFLYVDDMATASVFVMNLDKTIYNKNTDFMQSHINVGFGVDVTIAELATLIAKVTEYQGSICFDPSRPDGAPRKLINSSKLNNFGWRPRVNLVDGLRLAYQDFMQSSPLSL